MIRLSDALEVSLDYLLKDTGKRFPGKIRDSELIDQFVQADTLPNKDRNIVKALLEAFIRKHHFEKSAH